MSNTEPQKVAEVSDEQVLVVCTADLVNPDFPPVFASAEPQMVSKAAVEAFPGKFESDKPQKAVAPEPVKTTTKKATKAAEGGAEKRG